MRFLIVGCGAMGVRRARAVRMLGDHEIHGVDPREDRRIQLAELTGATVWENFEQGLEVKPDFALICTPPHLQAGYVLDCIEAGLDVFCETPVALDLHRFDQIVRTAEAARVFVGPSCTFLHNEIHRKIKGLLDEGKLGKPLAMASHLGRRLAAGRLDEDSGNLNNSKRSQGNMCFEALTQDFQLLAWLFGEVRALFCMARRRNTALDIEEGAFDVYDILVDMASGVSVTLHQDLFQRPEGDCRKIICENGTISWDWQKLEMGLQYNLLEPPEWLPVPLSDAYDYETMFADEMRHTLRALHGEEVYLMPLGKYRRILEHTLACAESSERGIQMSW